MIASRREQAWPGHDRAGAPRRARLARLGTPVLVVAAALFGAAVSATVLVGFWSTESKGKRAVEARLAATSAHATALAQANATLRRRLAASRAATVRLEQAGVRLRTAAQALLRENAALTASAGRLHARGTALEGRASSVSKLADTLGTDLLSVLSYITNTDAASLDPAYLKAQLDYLKPAVTNVRSAAQALGGDAGSYGTAVEGFAAEAAAYAEALRRLERAQTGG